MYNFSKALKTTIKAEYNINLTDIKDIKVAITSTIYKAIQAYLGLIQPLQKWHLQNFLW